MEENSWGPKTFGKQGVIIHVRWVKSHMTAKDVEKGKITYEDWVGNAKADKTAKKGAQQHGIPGGIEKYYHKELAVAIAWLRYLVGVHGCCLKEGKWAAEEWEERVERKESGSNLGGLKLTPHDFRPIKNKMGAYFCVNCRMHATECGMQRAMRLPCVPFLGEGGEQHTHPSHRIMRVSEVPHIYWCDRCGGLSCKQTFLLKGFANLLLDGGSIPLRL